MKTSESVSIRGDIFYDHQATVVEIDWFYNDIVDGGIETVTASAKKDPHDKFDPEIARDLALGRALQKLGRRLEKRANGRIKHNDEVRTSKRENKKKQEKSASKSFTN